MRSRGAALSGNLVITGAGGFGNSPRIIATDKETGKVVWESSFQDTPDVTFTAAPLPIKDKIIVGAAISMIAHFVQFKARKAFGVRGQSGSSHAE